MISQSPAPGAVNVATELDGFRRLRPGRDRSDDRGQGRRGHERAPARLPTTRRRTPRRSRRPRRWPSPRRTQSTASGATNAAGATMTLVSWSFTTRRPAGRSRARTPATNATGVALGTTVSVGFDRAVVSGSTAFQVVAGSTPVAGSLTLNAAGTIATFDPTRRSSPGTTYTVTVSGATAVGSADHGARLVDVHDGRGADGDLAVAGPGRRERRVERERSTVGFNQAVTGTNVARHGPRRAPSRARPRTTRARTWRPSRRRPR